jgi:hypothetical protein
MQSQEIDMTERQKIEAAAQQMIKDGLLREWTDENGRVHWALTQKGMDWHDSRHGKPADQTAQ